MLTMMGGRLPARRILCWKCEARETECIICHGTGMLTVPDVAKCKTLAARRALREYRFGEGANMGMRKAPC